MVLSTILVFIYIKGDIYERREGKPYSEDEARGHFTGLMSGLNCMHQYNVAHRDLKLENFLFTEKWTPMLSDFGFVAFNSDRLRRDAVELSQLMRQKRGCLASKRPSESHLN